MNLPTVIADTSDVTMTVRSDLTHLCPHVDETDHGRVEITWRANGETYELHSLRAYLDGYTDSTLSHEQVTDHIWHDLSATDGLDLIAVETTWQTAGMEVRCSTSPTRAVTR